MEKVQAIQIESLEDIKLHHRYLTAEEILTYLSLYDGKEMGKSFVLAGKPVGECGYNILVIYSFTGFRNTGLEEDLWDVAYESWIYEVGNDDSALPEFNGYIGNTVIQMTLDVDQVNLLSKILKGTY